MLPDDVIGLFQRRPFGGKNELAEGSHKIPDLGIRWHPADPVVPSGDDSHKDPVGGPIVSDGHGGMARLLLQFQDIRQSAIRGDVGVADHKTGLVGLGTGDHLRFALNGLGAVNK